MIKSVHLRRIVRLVVTTVVLSALLTAGLYSIFATRAFIQIKALELQSRASTLAGLLGSDRRDVSSLYVLLSMLHAEGLLGAHISLYDEAGSRVQIDPQARQTEIPDSQDLDRILRGYCQEVFRGKRVVYVNRLRGQGGFLVVGEPVINSSGTVYAALFMSKPLVELNAAMSNMNHALFLSMAGVFSIMLLPSYWAAGRLVKPIRRMRDVAEAMSHGDFGAFADEAQRGEIGQLAGALNLLSARLSRTISALMLERNRLKQVLDGLGEGILAVDERCNPTHVNPAFYRLMRIGEHAAIDRNAQGIPPMVWDSFRSVIDRKGSLHSNFMLGESIIHMDIVTLEDERELPAGAVGMFRDITSSERLEQTRREYVANVSHELRTPVASLQAMAETLRDGLVTEPNDVERYHDNMLRETVRLSRLIEDLLELSRLQSGTAALERRKMAWSELVYDLQERFQGPLAEAGVELSIEFDPEACPPAYSNADRIEQVLVILLNNAARFTPQGGRIAIQARWDDDRIYITVRDTGCGIAPEDIDHIFERFYKADKAHATSGTGLGLSIAWEIMHRMGEEITVQSRPGEGAAFTFTAAQYKPQA